MLTLTASRFFALSFPRSLVPSLLDPRNQLVQRHIERQDDEPDHKSEEHNQQRLQDGGQLGQRRFYLSVIEVCDLLQHAVQRAGLLTDGGHLHHHGRKQTAGLHGDGDALALADAAAYVLDGLRHDLVLHSLGHHFQRLHNGDATADQRAQRARESRDDHLADQRPEDRYPQLKLVKPEPARRRVDIHSEPVQGQQDEPKEDIPIAGEQLGTEDQDACRQRQHQVQTFEEPDELRQDEEHQEEDHTKGEGHDGRRIGDGGANFLAQRQVLFKERRHAVEHVVEHATHLAGAHHVDHERVECLRVLAERVGERHALLDFLANLADNLAEFLALRLLLED